MNRFVSSAAALAFALSAGVVHAAPPSQFPPALQVDKLDNGLTVVTVPFDSPGIVAYYTLVGAGSRDEVEAGKSGYAHLFEHLMFRGTDQVSADEYAKRIQGMGADDNANTSADRTLYTTTIAKDSFDDLVKLNADRFQHLHYAADKYKDETGAVLGERNKVFANPEAQMFESLSALAFKQHTYGHTTIGSKHDVEDMPHQYDYSLAFFKRFYTPDDCTIFVVGDFDHAKVLDSIKAAYGAWTGKRAKTNAKAEPEQKAPRAVAVPWSGPTEPRALIAYRAPASSLALADSAALATLIAATFGEPSDLYQRLVVRDQKVLELEADPGEVLGRDATLFTVAAKLKGTTSFDEVIGAVQAAIDGVAHGEMPAEKIQAARDHVRNGLVLHTQTPGQLATQLAELAVTTGDVHGLEKWSAALAAVKPEDVVRLAKTLTPAHRNVATLVSGPPSVAPGAKSADKKTDKTAKKGTSK